MSNFVTLAYEVNALSQGATAVQPVMLAEPLPPEFMAEFGLRVVTDLAPVANPVVRTILIAFGPSVPPNAAIITLLPGDVSGSVLDTAIVDSAFPGLDFIAPPTVVFTGGNPNREASATVSLNIQGMTVDSGGATYNASSFVVAIGAMPFPTKDASGNFAPSCIQDLNLTDRGAGYSVTSVVQFQGGLGVGGVAATADPIIVKGKIVGVRLTRPGRGYIKAPDVFIFDPAGRGSGAKIAAVMGEGTPATVALVVFGGAVTGVTITNPGAGYNGVPEFRITDPTGAGSGAAVTARMALDAITILDRGFGYQSKPVVTFQEVFKTYFPDTVSDQREPFFDLMTNAIAFATKAPCIAATPVLT